jgi:phosphate:Na+ symporter
MEIAGRTRRFPVRDAFDRGIGKGLIRKGFQTHKLNKTEAKELERLIYASRNMMNSLKNFKGVRHNMDEFDGSDNTYLNAQYKLFRKRLVELYHNMSRIFNLEDKAGQYRSLLTSFVQIEEADNRFIRNTLNAVAEQKIQEMEIASLCWLTAYLPSHAGCKYTA